MCLFDIKGINHCFKY
uniref:Sema domain-containing protein n=1 Tax=Arundo donax TaxID=35708 RepID=A0A0A8YF94_ARUDO